MKKFLPTQTPLAIETEAQTVLCGMEFVRSVFRRDDDSVIAMVDNGLHPRHLQFVFDVSCGQRLVRELRFWTLEVVTPGAVKNLTIDGAVEKILGTRDYFRRSDIILEWVVTHPHVIKLLANGEIKETGRRISRSSLEKFLKSRWIGAGVRPAQCAPAAARETNRRFL